MTRSRASARGGPAVGEKDFQAWMIDVARRFGWTVYHVHDSRRQVRPGVFVGDSDAAGLPDLILLHHDPPRLVFAELKGEGGKLRPAQKEFLRLARAVGAETAQGFPADVSLEGERGLGRRVVGAYSFRPGLEEQIETMLRTRVLL